MHVITYCWMDRSTPSHLELNTPMCGPWTTSRLWLVRYPSPHIEVRQAHTYTLGLDLTVTFEISGMGFIGYLWTPPSFLATPPFKHPKTIPIRSINLWWMSVTPEFIEEKKKNPLWAFKVRSKKVGWGDRVSGDQMHMQTRLAVTFHSVIRNPV